MKIGVLKEQDEDKVVLCPREIRALRKKEVSIWVETDAGVGVQIDNKSFQEAGAEIKSRSDILSQADLILSYRSPSSENLGKANPSASLIYTKEFLAKVTASNSQEGQALMAFDLSYIPRSTRAQAMDVLSSMASIAGYQAAILSALHLPKYFPMMMTAAGTIPPAKVLILGVGVAGLQAIATARRLGAQVEAFDVRESTREEVLSLGAKFIDIPGAKDDKNSAYAQEQDEAFLKRQRETLDKHISRADVVITTAQVRGRKAPILVKKEAIERMKKGSVIIDMATSSGGNVEGSQNNKTVSINGVKIIGDSALEEQAAMDASMLLSKNYYNFISLLLAQEDYLNSEDDIIEACKITHSKTLAT
ncbi:MAG: NAD(P) transhydrogenase subunit alpha [Bacteroidota bacterium]